MASGILSLPDELLTTIVSYLDPSAGREWGDNGRPDHCAVALTCQRLSRIACALLVRRLVFDVNNNRPDYHRVELFNRACAQNPQICQRIRSARVLWACNNRNPDILSGLDTFLKALGFVTDLKIQVHAHHRVWSLPYLFETGATAFPNLQTLKFESQYTECISAQHVMNLCKLPNISSLTLKSIIGLPSDDNKSPSIEPEPAGFVSTLKRLRFCCSSPIRYSVLRDLLPYLPHLNHLALEAVGAGVHFDRKMSDCISMRGADLTEPLRPETIGKLLAPIENTVETIELTLFNVTFPTHDGSRIDLRPFTALRNVLISSYYLFGSDLEPSHARRGVWERLPSGITDLQVSFDGMQGMFYSMTKCRRWKEGGDFRVWPGKNVGMNDEGLAWLVELIRKKPDACPNLQKIRATEDEIVDRIRTFKIVKWDLTEQLAELCREFGVEVEVELRVPMDWDSGMEVVWDFCRT